MRGMDLAGMRFDVEKCNTTTRVGGDALCGMGYTAQIAPNGAAGTK